MEPIELKPAFKNEKGELEFERVVVVVKKDKSVEAITEEEYHKLSSETST